MGKSPPRFRTAKPILAKLIMRVFGGQYSLFFWGLLQGGWLSDLFSPCFRCRAFRFQWCDDHCNEDIETATNHYKSPSRSSPSRSSRQTRKSPLPPSSTSGGTS